MRIAIIENDTVKNIIEATEELVQSQGLEYTLLPCNIGDAFDGTNVIPHVPVKNIETIKEQKRQEIKNYFENAARQPITAEGFAWNGGVNSAFLINGMADVLGHRGNPNGVIHDKDNKPHIMTANTMKNIAAIIAEDYQIKFTRKQALMVAIEEATTLAEVEAITW